METQVITKEEYLTHLGAVFPHLANDVEYEWAFCRKCGSYSPDVFVLRAENGEIAAGSAVTYREIKNDSQSASLIIGIMTGSWTLPKFRNQGCFSRIIQDSLVLVKHHGADALTAFVTADNASARRLQAAGSKMVPASYIFSTPSSENHSAEDLEIVELPSDELGKIDFVSAANAKLSSFSEYRFTYDVAAFQEQFIKRPLPTNIFRVNGKIVITEESHDAVKILFVESGEMQEVSAIIKKISLWAAGKREKKIYYYTTSNELRGELDKCGFVVRPGFFTVLPVAGNEFHKNIDSFSIAVQLGDKM